MTEQCIYNPVELVNVFRPWQHEGAAFYPFGYWVVETLERNAGLAVSAALGFGLSDKYFFFLRQTDAHTTRVAQEAAVI